MQSHFGEFGGLTFFAASLANSVRGNDKQYGNDKAIQRSLIRPAHRPSLALDEKLHKAQLEFERF